MKIAALVAVVVTVVLVTLMLVLLVTETSSGIGSMGDVLSGDWDTGG